MNKAWLDNFHFIANGVTTVELISRVTTVSILEMQMGGAGFEPISVTRQWLHILTLNLQ